MLYERAPTPHWKHGTVDWKEIQMTWTLEEPTRQAQILAGETHLTELNKDLTDDLVTKGYKLIRSRRHRAAGPDQFRWAVLRHRGQGHRSATPKTVGPQGKLDPEAALDDNVKVRQAINKAINRDELLQGVVQGPGQRRCMCMASIPDLPGWDPTWEKRFPEMYGYDPAAAKRLLAEAGYPKGFKAKAWLFPFAGAPELIPLMEAVQIQLREVGIEI